MRHSHLTPENNNEATEMIKSPLSVVRVAAFCLPLALVASCGSGSEAVQGTVINLDPSNLGTIGLSVEFFDSVDYVQVVRIEAKSPSGYPQIGTKLLIDSGFVVYAGHPQAACSISQTYAAGPPVVGQISTCTAVVATPLPLPYAEASTSSNGTYEVTVIYSISPFSTGDITTLQVWRGTGFQSLTVESECLDPISGGGRAECA